MQLCRGLAAGGAGSFLRMCCSAAWCGLDSQPLSPKSNADTTTKDLASFLCIAAGCRKGCGKELGGFMAG